MTRCCQCSAPRAHQRIDEADEAVGDEGARWEDEDVTEELREE